VGPGAGATGPERVTAAPGSGAPTGPTHPQPVPVPMAPAPPRRRRRRTWLWVLLVVLLAIGGGVAAFLLVSDGSSSGKGSGNGAVSEPPTANATITTATAFDPLGDGHEGDELTTNAIDGDNSTTWTTEQYDNFPDGEKNGVGLALSLDREYDVTKVMVDTLKPGWGASIYVSNQPVESLTALSDWGDARAKGSDLPASHTFEVSGVKGRSVLLWLTQLPTGQNKNGETKHFVDVAEVKVA
jgi:putative peptidoglycan lipid II flippase